MGQFPVINAGTDFTAALLQALAPLNGNKTVDETQTTLTLQNDDALFIPVAANAVYLFVMFLNYDGGTGGSSDLKTGWTWPSGTTMAWTQLARSTAGTAIAGNFSIQTGTPALGTAGTGSKLGAVLVGIVTTGGTAGTLQFQWCTNTTPAVATTVHAGSALLAWRLQ